MIIESNNNNEKILILCYPELPNYLTIDNNNNLYFNLHIKIEELTQYSDMIIRQTESLENIVEEFSKFARMPKINKVRSNFSEILEHNIFLYS